MDKPKHYTKEDRCSVVLHGKVIGHVIIRRHLIEFIENGKWKVIPDKKPDEIIGYYPKK